MKLKKLQIQGFKSFLDRTSLNFSDGITAIVGPNGCGKSNVVDAIRWAMGEQSAKHLRGKLMEDVIFNGTQELQPLGMAEVTLVFDNTAGLAPAEYSGFSEVQVSRRLFRSGESEYYINRTPCRLKDITELFLGTGVGKQAYSIVEQGQIDTIISAKPEERRALIEEAAGISKYRSRKQEAERKIEATRQNLLRIQDIIGEIKRQMNSLNRQAKKAERFKQYRDELKEIELELAARRILSINKEMEELGQSLKDAQRRDQEIQIKLESDEAEIEHEKVELLNAERELHRSQEKMHQAQSAIQARESGLLLTRKEIENKGQRIERFDVEMEDLRTRIADAQSELTGLEKERSLVNAQRGQINRDSAEAQAEIEVMSREQSRHMAELEEKKREQSRLHGEIMKLENTVQHTQERIRDMTGQLEKCRSEAGGLNPEIEAAQKVSFNFNQNLYEMRKILDQLGRQVKLVAGEIGELKRAIAEQNGREKEIEDRYHVARSRLQSLMEMQANFEGCQRGVKSIMEHKKAHQDNGGRGIHGLIAEVLDTEPEYELAVEAVLGERLQAVVVDTPQVGLDAISYLKEGERGRGSFIPLMARGEEETAVPEALMAGGARPLLEVVRPREEYAQVVKALLGEVILVQDANQAAEFWKGNGFKKTMVTRDGVVIDPHGVITGGSRDSYGFLEKKREIRDLQAQVEELEQARMDAAEKLKTLQEELLGKEQDYEMLRDRHHKQELDIVNLEKDLKNATDKFNQFQARAENLNKEEAELNERIEQSRVSIADAEAETAKMREQLSLLAQELNQRQKTIVDLTPSLQALSQKSTELKVQLAALSEKLESIGGQIGRLNKTREELTGSIERRIQERESVQAEMATLTRQIEQQKIQLTGMINEQTEFESVIHAAREQYESGSQELYEKETGLSHLRKEREQIHERIGDMELSLDKLRNQAEHVAESVQDKYFVALDRVLPEYRERVSVAEYPEQERRAAIDDLRDKLERMGDVNLTAIDEYKELEGRFSFLTMQEGDLIEALSSLEGTITRINTTYRREFKRTFDKVNEKFQEVCPKLFRGGKAMLVLTNESELLETGVDIVVQPPGKKLQAISLLSGGEKSLAAVALIISLFLIRPSPFCLLDEVDAALDDVNVDRFNDIVRDMAQDSQFILITHNKRTMGLANTLYGVTMEKMGISKVVSVKLN